MPSSLTVARPYARAVFEMAREANAVAAWSAKLAFAVDVAADARVGALFGNPRVGVGEFVSLFLPEGEPADSAFARFIRLLADNHRLPALPEIGALFEELKAEAERLLKVRVRTAAPLDAAALDKLRTALGQRFARAIEIEQTSDPDLLGGAVIDAGDVVIDGSVRGRLERLEQALTQ